MRLHLPWLALALLLVGVLFWAAGGSGTASATEPAPAALVPAPDAVVVDRPAESAAATEAPRIRAQSAGASANAETPRSPDELSGRVLDAATKAPLANAEVALLRAPFDSYVGLYDDDSSPVVVLATAKTDADGRFAFAVEPAASCRVRAATPSHAERTVLQCTGGSFVTIELDRAASIVCSVRTEQGPLAGAEVRLADEETYLDRSKSHTDAAGVARFVGQPAGRVTVALADPRVQFATANVDVVAGKEHRIELHAKTGRAVRGVVRDAASRAPVAHARVFRDSGFGPSVVTDANGRFELGGLATEGSMRVLVRAEGYAQAAASLPYGSTDEFDVALSRGAAVTGRIVDEDGRGLAGASGFLAAQADPGYEVVRVAVDAEGRFHVTCLSPGKHYWLVARAPERGTQVRVLPRPLAEGERRELPDLVLHAACSIEGRVQDDQGRLLEGLWVECNGLPDEHAQWAEGDAVPNAIPHAKNRIARTDAEGRFRIGGLATGEFLVAVRTMDAGRVAERTVRIAAGETLANVEFTLAAGLPIAGTFVPATAASFETQFAVYVTAVDAKLPTRGWTNVNRDGSFRIEGMKPGRYAVELLPQPAGQVLPPGTIVEAGREDLRIVLEAASSVAGKVVDGKGQPLAARVVCFSEPDHQELAIGIASPDGSFRLEVPASFRGVVGAFPIQGTWKPLLLQGVVANRTDLVLVVEGDH